MVIKRCRHKGPVFVVGMNGSGTTMLADCLGNHPGLYILPTESRILPFFISRLPSYGSLMEIEGRRHLADDLGKSYPFSRANGNVPLVLADSELDQPGFSGVVDSLYTHLAEKEGKVRWGDKSPMYVQHLPLLSSHFPESKFIHIYRDGRDVARSFHRRWKKVPMRTIYRWKKVVEMGRKGGAALGPSRYFEVSYEAFTHAPESFLKEICRFLALDFDVRVTQPSMRQMDPKIKQKKIVKNTGKWAGYFKESQVAHMETIAGKCLADLSYATKTCGDVDPSPGRLAWWRWEENWQNTTYHFRRYGVKSLPAFIGGAVTAIRQRRSNRF